MKIKPTFFIAAFVIFLTSCDKEEPTPETPENPDTEVPTLELEGDLEIYMALNSAYVEPGFIATDVIDDEVEVEVTGQVLINYAGTYELLYTASDDAGNQATASRIVHVINESASRGGEYLVTPNCSATSSTEGSYTATLVASETQNNKMTVYNLYINYATSPQPVIITMDAQSVFIEDQEYGGIPIIGNGSIDGDNFYIDTEYYLTTCTQTFVKQ